VNIINPTIDTCINKVLMRFELFRAISTRSRFMMPAQLNQISDDDLCTSATEFAKLNEDDVSQDVVRQFRSGFSQAKGITGPRDALQFIVENKLQSMMPDVVTCYMLFLTLPVTVASCERSFSKLRMIQNYLRHPVVKTDSQALHF
jgi:hAT family C-terminal dimerisation region